MVSMRSEKPIIMRSIPSLRSFPNVAFETVPMLVWLTMVLSRPFKERLLFLRLSPPGHQWCDVLGFVSAGSVSSFSTLQIFRETSHLRWLLCPPVYLLGYFPSLRHVQGSTPTGYSERGCRLSIHSILGFPFHFSLEVFAQIKQKRSEAIRHFLGLFKSNTSIRLRHIGVAMCYPCACSNKTRTSGSRLSSPHSLQVAKWPLG